MCREFSMGVPRKVHIHVRSHHRTSRRVLPARGYLMAGVLALSRLAQSLFPVSLTGAVAHAGGKGEAFVCYIGDLISFFNYWKNYFRGDYMQCRFIFA